MAPSKENKAPSTSVEQLHQKAISLGEIVRSLGLTAKKEGERASANSKSHAKFVEPEIPVPPPIVSSRLEDNPYAQEIFMCKTNVRDVATEAANQSGVFSKEKIRKYRIKLYRLYASDPKLRIRDPLERVRFESEYYEYRFFLALNKPLHSEEQYQDYKKQLEAAGIAESWVSMRQDNRLLVYEDQIVTKLKARFNRWSNKLDKLDFYLTDMHSKEYRAESHSKPVAEESSEDDKLFEDVLKRSNAKNILSEAQIRAKFDKIKLNLLAPVKVGFGWLVFEDDELNKRYQLGPHRTDFIAEMEEVDEIPPRRSTSSNSRPSSVASGDSEIAQMRSEMAMTQPQEMLPIEGCHFSDTNDLVNALEPVEEPCLPEMATVDEPMIEPIVTEQLNPELSPMITPAQADVVEISDSPVNDNDLVHVKEEFIFTLEYMKKYTNMEQCVMNHINEQSPRKAKRGMRNFDEYVKKYYELKKSILLKNVLPPELRMLTRKERRERQAKAATLPSVVNPPDAPPTASEAMEPSVQTEISPYTETPLMPRVKRKHRILVYEEDEEEQPLNRPTAAVPEDTLPMPNSEDFLPSVFSTQLPGDGDGGAQPRRQDTPFQTPARQSTPQGMTASSSRDPSPSPNVTIIANKNVINPPAIKTELNRTSYEDEVEFVELNDAPIVINESIDNSQNIPELLARQANCLGALPNNLHGLVNKLFLENRDTTLSQGSGASSGSSSSRLSQDIAVEATPSMGFCRAPAENAEQP